MSEISKGILESSKAEFARQPLAVSLQLLAVLLAVPSVAAAFGWLKIPSVSGTVISSGVSSAIGLTATLMLLLSPLAAMASGRVYRKSAVGGFCLSIILAHISMFLAMLPISGILMASAISANGKLSSPSIDLIYWGTLLIFFGFNGELIARDLGKNSPDHNKQDSQNSDATGMIGILFLGALFWGSILSSGQQKLLGLITHPVHLQVKTN